MKLNAAKVALAGLGLVVFAQCVMTVRHERQLRGLSQGVAALARALQGARAVSAVEPSGAAPNGRLEIGRDDAESELGALQRELSQWVGWALGDLDRFGLGAVAHSGFRTLSPLPAVDARMDGTNYVISLSIPGLAREDISVTLQGSVLSVETDGRERAGAGRRGGRDRAGGRTLVGRVQLPAAVPDQDRVRASYEGGVLKVVVPQETGAGGVDAPVPSVM